MAHKHDGPFETPTTEMIKQAAAPLPVQNVLVRGQDEWASCIRSPRDAPVKLQQHHAPRITHVVLDAVTVLYERSRQLHRIRTLFVGLLDQAIKICCRQAPPIERRDQLMSGRWFETLEHLPNEFLN